ncbi:PEP-CTERM sorting domain-containing protein [Pseudodesulfovibrio cashew]|uniref:PEP-CTERM sorting domain-containing protein n=1 Tax=Pseudodesulfovibrio cashew TaxID=2678688 RepID=UPI00131AB80E|nr:PEP-CTERM sorting domain-containing protein [Pseudodesulfovibrio cashew]
MILFAFPALASASTSTTTSLTSFGALPGTVSEVGGIVLELKGQNNNRVVAQLSASSLYVGYAGSTPQTIGTQTGFTASILSSLGGGLLEAAVRVTLWDGDTAPGDFDDGDVDLWLNGIYMQNFSNVLTERTSSTGTSLGATSYGFNDDELRTGFFYSSDNTFLSSLYASMAGGSIAYSLFDADTPGDNYYDFTQGVDASLIDVGTGPQLNPSVPEPGTVLLMAIGMGGLLVFRRKRHSA